MFPRLRIVKVVNIVFPLPENNIADHQGEKEKAKKPNNNEDIQRCSEFLLLLKIRVCEIKAGVAAPFPVLHIDF